MFSIEIETLARLLIDEARERQLRLVTAESCTGGLVAGAICAIPGASDVFERGFVVSNNRAKQELLGVPGEIIAEPAAFLKDGLSAAHREHLAESLAALGLPAWTIRVLDASETDDGEHQSGYQLTREVERERHEQRRADRARVESHPATSLIMGRWPGARLGEVERSETATEESVV